MGFFGGGGGGNVGLFFLRGGGLREGRFGGWEGEAAGNGMMMH